MKDELQGKLVEILTSLQAAAGKATDVAVTQLPEIAQSYVLYGRLYLTVAILVGIAGIYIARRFEVLSRDDYSRDSLWVIASCTSFIFSIVLLATHFQEFFLVWAAPKVWLLKEIAGLLK